MKKKWSLVGLTFLSVGLLAACSNNESADNKSKELVVSTFALSEDIIEADIIKPFEEAHDVKIIMETGTSSERYTKFENNPNSTVDVIELSQSNAAKGYEKGLFAEIDAEKVPNMDELSEKAKELSADGSGPATTVNSIGIIYNEEAAGMKIENWSDLWDPSLAGKISIPDITTTYGPAMMYVANDYKKADIETDKGKGAFKGLTELAPNVLKTYSKSSDLANLFQSGEIVAAVVGDFAYPLISQANPTVQYVFPESGTYANYNTINVNANSKNKELAYEFINWRISQELQEKTAESLNEAPTNTSVVLDEETAQHKTYGEVAERTTSLNFDFVNANLADWISEWNHTLNQ
ncbi:MAG: ABC transporter substrate-binding protein [Carnobacterium sp.]|uniref:ABC transporter substrate-binding protein n=1 Tax=Carnobacterium sp. TaxID=48221 RepID=UPI002FC753B7